MVPMTFKSRKSGPNPFDQQVTIKADQVAARLEALLPLLRAGKLKPAIQELETLARWGEPSAGVLYNLGLAHSQSGDFERAVDLQRRCVEIDPTHDNAWVAIGVALGQLGKGDEAREAYEKALAINADNPYAMRNLASALIEVDGLDRAESLLNRARSLLRNDPITLFNLGNVMTMRFDASSEMTYRQRAESFYREVVELVPDTNLGDQARAAINRFSQQQISKHGPRPDVLMYILGALERFDTMTDIQRNAMVLEVALLGQKGLTLDSSRKYKLKSAPGKEFTGIHLLAIMYTGLRIMGQQPDMGMDFSVEFDGASTMHAMRKKKQEGDKPS